ncbi:MAG: T9SS type A sorting domain-containing protein [Bacteroidetes bacterium]|nr:T9SS type A sorting domain-containing protein [Bacteroidota bacterium]
MARTGLGYAGIGNAIVNLSNPNQTYREYIQTELIDSLLPGVEYTISFYVSAGDSCGRHTNNFGAYFSNNEIDTVIYPYSNLTFLPQFENPVTNDISDRIGWTQLTSTFFANGGEKYLILGNFRDTPNTTIIITGWGTNPSFATSAYLYIDDILVTPTDSITSINEFNSNENLSISTLSGYEFEIKSKNHPINSFEVLNCLGQIIDKKGKLNENALQINMHEFANGIYFIRVRLKNEKIHIFKISKP